MTKPLEPTDARGFNFRADELAEPRLYPWAAKKPVLSMKEAVMLAVGLNPWYTERSRLPDRRQRDAQARLVTDTLYHHRVSGADRSLGEWCRVIDDNGFAVPVEMKAAAAAKRAMSKPEKSRAPAPLEPARSSGAWYGPEPRVAKGNPPTGHVAQDSVAQTTKARAKAAANALHNKPGGAREKQQRIREIWASGKYGKRDVCAEQECAGLQMSFASARKALRNTPDPKRG